MRTILTIPAIVAALAFGCATAFAQSSPSATSGTAASPASPSSSQAASPASTPRPPMTQDKVHQVMKEAGFTGVTIMDAAYLVQATTKDGDQILVLVNAPMMNRAGAAAASSGTAASGKSGSNPPKQ